MKWIDPIKSNKGSVHLLFCTLTLVLFSSGIGAWAVFNRWHALVKTQIRLDECVGSQAKALRQTLNLLDDGNKAILGAKVILVPLLSVPGANVAAIATLRTTMLVAARAQDALKAKWKLSRLRWTSRLGCRKLMDLGSELPSLDGFKRLPPDPSGPGILLWEPREPDAFQIRLKSGSRASSARIARGEIQNGQKANPVSMPTQGPLSLSRWKASWRGTAREKAGSLFTRTGFNHFGG